MDPIYIDKESAKRMVRDRVEAEREAVLSMIFNRMRSPTETLEDIAHNDVCLKLWQAIRKRGEDE